MSTIDIQEQTETQIRGRLESTFLTMQYIYSFSGWHDCDEKKRSQWIQYSATYKGPHFLLIVVNDATLLPSEAACKIIVDELPYSDIYALAKLFYPAHSKKIISLVQAFFKKNATISFDEAWLLFHYGILIGGTIDSFMTDCFDDIFTPEQSLFTLSSLLLGQQKKLFFELWNSIKLNFSEVFWTSFWSEQFFRAYAYVGYMQKKNIAEAKKNTYRLPFSFIQKDWKLCSLSQLQEAHNRVYELDYALKNGAGSYGFDLLFGTFFLSTQVNKK